MRPWGIVDVVQPGVGRRPWAVEIEHVACGRNLRKIKNAEVMLIRVLARVGRTQASDIFRYSDIQILRYSDIQKKKKKVA